MFSWFKSSKSDPLPQSLPESAEDFVDPSSVLETFTAMTGIHFRQKEAIVSSKLIHFCRDRNIRSFVQLHDRIRNDLALREALINYLTVNETYFFREPSQIAFMVSDAIRRGDEPFRILCAPGSSGEEPYSIAIALLEKGVGGERIEIVSIDINSEANELGKRGEYHRRAFHKTPAAIIENYFDDTSLGKTIRTEVKGLVRFETLNIFDEALFGLGRFDYIFSRNMLIYFDPPTAQKAIERLGRLAQSPQSLFFFGHADIVGKISSMEEHYEEGVKYYTPKGE